MRFVPAMFALTSLHTFFLFGHVQFVFQIYRPGPEVIKVFFMLR